MSEEKTIKIKFQGKEVSCSIQPSYEDFLSLFKKEFSMDDKKMKKISFNYFDNDDDKNCLENEDDFLAFFNLNSEKEKIIEAEIDENAEIVENENIEENVPRQSLYGCAPISNSIYPTEVKNIDNENEQNKKEDVSLSQQIKKNEKLPIMEEKIVIDEKIKTPSLPKNNIEEKKLIKDIIVNPKNENEESNKINNEKNKNDKEENNNEMISSINFEEEDNEKDKEKNLQTSSKDNDVKDIKDNKIINEKKKEVMIMDNNKEKKNLNNAENINNKNNNADNMNNRDNNAGNINNNNNNANNINNNNENHNNNNANNNVKTNNDNNDKKGCKINWVLLISILVNVLAILFYLYKNRTEKKTTNQIIIGIDFGSTFSGYSVIFNSNIDFEDSDLNQVISSELIMDKETKIGLRIGKLAHYFPKNKVVIENKLYFCKFKRNLDPKNSNNYCYSNIPEGQEIELENVIKGFLVLLREDIQNNNHRIRTININDIKWIIAVPPLWDEKGKKFMKDVAYKSGMIHSEIALEPEAASLAIFHDKSIKKKFLQKGKTFLIVDAGGYTVDISANKIIDDYENLEQLLMPASEIFGSNIINERIIEIIYQIYGKEKIEEMKKKDYEAWERILDSIEEKKKQIDDNTAENFIITGKFLNKNCRTMSDNCKSNYNGTEITYSSNQIDIPAKIIISIISEIANKIVNQINKCFSKTNENIDLIVLTGGFSNCKIFEKEVRKNFRGSLKELVFLKSPQETVMRGSAIFGLRPNQILYRISPVTIGVNNYEIIKENDECQLTDRNEKGELVCLKYKIFVERTKSIKTNQVLEHIIKPINDTVNIYSSFDDEINENDKNILDSLEIPSSDLPFENRTIIVSMKFSNYINVSVIDDESKKSNWKIIYYPS